MWSDSASVLNVPLLRDIQQYWLDAWQRSVLFLDVLRERGNIYLEHSAREVQHVLSFQAELIRDGRTLARPVNYGLVRIIPPPPAPRPIPRRRPSSSSIRAPATARASAA